MSFDSVPLRSWVILCLILISYVITLAYVWKEGQFGSKSAVLLIVNTGSQVQQTSFLEESRVEEKSRSGSRQNTGHQEPPDRHYIEPDSNLRTNLLPPSQVWISSQTRQTMSLLGLEYPSSNHWRKCGPRTYYFPKVCAIFTGIPKTGCTNWITALLRTEGMLSKTPKLGEMNWIHGAASMKYRMNHVSYVYSNSDFEKAFSFAVVRNPWTRLVSGFRDKLSSEKTSGPSLRSFGLWVVRQMRGIKDPAVLKDLYPTFEEFAGWLIKRGGTVNAHFQPQTAQLCLKYAVYDFIAPLEYAGSLSEVIMKKINASDASLLGSYDKSSDPRYQKSTLLAKKWLSELDQDVIDSLYDIFKADFALLNYSNFTHPDFPFPLHNL